MEYFFGKNNSFANPHCSQFKECLKYLMINKSSKEEKEGLSYILRTSKNKIIF